MQLLKAITTAILSTNIISAALSAEEVTFKTMDGGIVYADEFIAETGKTAPLLILFHQARANGRGEYEYTFPRLQAAGYSLLVVDQRSGGDLFGQFNRTVNARGESTGYCEAYDDLEAAINYVELSDYSGPIFAAGSSYSAGLVIRLGAEYSSTLNGVIAFSPASGGPMKDCSPNIYADSTKTPTMILRPEREMENPAVQEQFALFEKEGHTMFIAKNGVHGSSMLNPNRTGKDTETTWQAVMNFLNKKK